MKDSLSSDHDEEAVLEECIWGVKHALEEYDDKLKCTEFPTDVRDLISCQRNKVTESLTSVKIKECSCG